MGGRWRIRLVLILVLLAAVVPEPAAALAAPGARAVPGRAGSGEPAPTARVRVSGQGLNVRAGPSTRHRIVGTAPDGATITVQCQVTGEMINGSVRRTAVWDRLPGGRYVSDGYVSWRSGRPGALPWCDGRPPADFISWVAKPARRSMRDHRVPASVTIGQAILESGWGRSELSRVDHNYFGIKCFGSPGEIAIGCRRHATTECSRGQCFPTTALFRVYRKPADSFADHGRYLATSRRYQPAFGYTRDPDRFAIEIHKAGYATSPVYAQSLINLMRRYDLYRFDGPSSDPGPDSRAPASR